jgi:hypothetical protein
VGLQIGKFCTRSVYSACAKDSSQLVQLKRTRPAPFHEVARYNDDNYDDDDDDDRNIYLRNEYL